MSFKSEDKEKEDFCEKYGCVCCGGGYLHLDPIVWFLKMADMIEYVKNLGKTDNKEPVKKDI